MKQYPGKEECFYYKNAICQDMHTSENKESSLDEGVLSCRTLDGQIKVRFNIRSITLNRQQEKQGCTDFNA